MTNNTQVVVLAIIKKDQKYLLTLRHDPGSQFHGFWQIPGGGNEFAETPLATLHREVREELGIEVKNVRLIPYIDTEVRGSWHGIFISFVCEMKDEKAPIELNEEATEYAWYTLDEMKNLQIFPGCIEVIEASQ